MNRRAIYTSCGCVVLAVAGCREPSATSRGPVSQPDARPVHKPASLTTAPAPTTAPTPTTHQTTVTTPGRIVVRVRDLSEPQWGWLVIEEMVESGTPASAIGVVAGPRKLVVTTNNVQGIRIDLPKAGMPSDRRVVLRIDDQGIEITGRRGPIARFERSRQGAWSARHEKN